MKSFEDLDCWKRSAALRRRLSSVVKGFPKEEKYRLVDQIIRASRSVTANIAEGFGRYHYQVYIQYCRQARGSLFELVDHLIVANEEQYITESQLKELKSEIEVCLAVLNGFINYLSKAKSQSTDGRVSEPEIVYETQGSQLTINDYRLEIAEMKDEIFIEPKTYYGRIVHD
ncbi:MAG: four helix bundle protein [Bacteroidota bacterium]